MLYDTPYPNEEKETPYPGLSYQEIQAVDGTIHLPDTQAILDLFQMTPYFWKTPRQGALRLAGLPQLDTTISFRIHVFRKQDRPEGAPVLHRKAAHRAVLIGRRGVRFAPSPPAYESQPCFFQRRNSRSTSARERRKETTSAMGAASSAPLKPKAWDNSSARGISTTACRTKGMARACTGLPIPWKKEEVAM